MRVKLCRSSLVFCVSLAGVLASAPRVVRADEDAKPVKTEKIEESRADSADKPANLAEGLLDPALPVEKQWENYKAAAIKYYALSPEQIALVENIYTGCKSRLEAAQKLDVEPKTESDSKTPEASAVSKLTDEFVYRVDSVARLDQIADAAKRGFESPRKKEPAPKPEPGNMAPDFTLDTKEGKPVSLSQLRGKVVVLTFWASWCGYCKKTLPDIETLYEKYKDNENVQIIGINCREKSKDNSQALAILKEKGYKFPVLYQGDPAAAQYEVAGFPTLFIVDQDGKIIHKQRGHRDRVDRLFEPIIEGALKGSPSAASAQATPAKVPVKH